MRERRDILEEDEEQKEEEEELRIRNYFLSWMKGGISESPNISGSGLTEWA